ncbi:plastocyanin/azurin family copper-binding protein [Cohnella sp. CFH 77786]|uniref:plastocyanin/azurin family copper-binding protein n=1 Tax=Cohnella sp. CFH 77786 TaxID=2662265 RepID=UPI001C6087F0|nr:plastocyanin/azurin family copper-binding protein [Cohnella sp. CFH 77786]
MMKKVRMLLLALLLLTVGSTGAYAAEGAAESAPQSWDVSVGQAMDHDSAMFFSMQPGTVYIHEGDTVTFTNRDMAAPHTVTFLVGGPPIADDKSPIATDPSGVQWDGSKLLNSGELMPQASYAVTFTKSGAYAYYCAYHPTMKGTVVVLPKGQPIPSKVEQAAAQKAHEEDLMKQAEWLKNYCGVVNYSKNSNGTLTYKAYASAASAEVMINAYLPGELYINAGDTIEWTNPSPEVHLVVVNMPKDLQVFTEQGPNPLLMTPSKQAYDGKGMATSGIMMGPDPFRLTFTKPGTYTITDPFWGFTGKVVVAAKGAAKLVVDGKAVVLDTQVKNGHVFAPVNAVAKALGAKAAVAKKKVTINGKALVSGSDSAPYEKSGTTYVALDAVANHLGKAYSWDQTALTFTLKTK